MIINIIAPALPIYFAEDKTPWLIEHNKLLANVIETYAEIKLS
jgi:hypothetical protein